MQGYSFTCSTDEQIPFLHVIYPSKHTFTQTNLQAKGKGFEDECGPELVSF